MNKWTKGEIIKLKSGKPGQQWFKFEATKATHRIYIKLDSVEVDVYLYDGNSEQIGNSVNVRGNSGEVKYGEWSLTVGETYYIAVKGSSDESAGKYFIGFTDLPAQPETVLTDLTENKWMNGKIVSSESGGTDEQWFKFIATDSTQYIYVKFSTLTNLNAYLYDIDFNLIGSFVHKYGSSGDIENFSRSVNNGELYYLKITKGDYAYNTSDTGTYWIGFTNFPAHPEKIITKLVVDKWVNSKINSNKDGDDYEWFSFTATDSNLYVYVKFSTLTNLNVYLYDDALNQIGTGVHQYGSADNIKSFSRSVNDGKLYYIKITKGDYAYNKSDVGSFWISFNSTGTPPQQ